MQDLSQFHDLILCVISALEARDPYTSHHSSRDTDICKGEIEKNIGIMYDPAIAKKVIENWDKVINKAL